MTKLMSRNRNKAEYPALTAVINLLCLKTTFNAALEYVVVAY